MTAKERRQSRTWVSILILAGLAISISGCATMGGGARSSSLTGEPMAAADSITAGDEAARRGDFERALVYYLQAVDSEPSVEAWLRVAAASTRAGDRQRAANAYLRVVELDPQQADALEGAGLQLVALGDTALAGTLLQRAIEQDSQRWKAHNALGVLADAAQDYATAIDHYEHALALNPRSAMLLNNIGYSRFLSQDYEQAARDFFAATEADPANARAWSNLALVYAQRGWYADAVRTLAKVADKPTAYNDIGYIAFRNGDFEQAELLLSEAVRVSPVYYAKAYQNLESVRVAMRDSFESTPSRDQEIQNLLSGGADRLTVGER